MSLGDVTDDDRLVAVMRTLMTSIEARRPQGPMGPPGSLGSPVGPGSAVPLSEVRSLFASYGLEIIRKGHQTLTFDDLRAANVTRCETSFHPLDDWSPSDWACALAGEVGEACNKIKKLKRGDKISLEDIGKELADAVCYLDLLAARLRIDLGEATIGKFNEVSKKVGSIFMLEGARKPEQDVGGGVTQEEFAESLRQAAMPDSIDKNDDPAF